MTTSTVKVLPTSFVVGGWTGELTIDNDTLNIVKDDLTEFVTINVAEVRRTSFNSANGLWIFRLKNGAKIRMQSAGGFLSADRTPAGKAANEHIKMLLAKYKVPGLRI